jgi:hypothetical protein
VIHDLAMELDAKATLDALLQIMSVMVRVFLLSTDHIVLFFQKNMPVA